MDFVITQGNHGLIREGFVWKDIPTLAIITGPNGVGKTQLLQSISTVLGYTDQHWRVYGLEGRAALKGGGAPDRAVFLPSEWPGLRSGGSEDLESIRRTMKDFYESKNSAQRAPRHESEWKRLESETGKPRDEIAIEDILPHLNLDFFSVGDLNEFHSVTRLFFVHHVLNHILREQGVSEAVCRERLGPAPWDVLNEILQTSDLPFRVNQPEGKLPSIFGNLRYRFELRDTRSGTVVDPDLLSSGERIIMSMVIWRYAHSRGNRGPVTLLLDEPDAHLHPSLTRKFLDVIKEDFVLRWGYRVIITTHSPTTAALAPEGSLFEMSRDPVTVLPSSDRWRTVDRLTEGFVTVGPDTKYVFVEDRDDAAFYTRLYEEIALHDQRQESELRKRPNLVFIPVSSASSAETGGRSKIEGMLQVFGPGSPIAGIADNDGKPKTAAGVHLTARCMLENYLYDPLCVFGHLAARELNPIVPGVPERINEREIRLLTAEQKQAIVDVMVSRLQKFIDPMSDRRLVPVLFTDGTTLQYPQWALSNRGKKLLPQEFAQSFGRLIRREELQVDYWKVGMFPVDLVHLLARAQGTVY